VAAVPSTDTPGSVVGAAVPTGDRATADAVPFTLGTPAGADGLITGSSVHVDGRLDIRASSIRIALERDVDHRIDAVDIDTNPDGLLRLDTTPTFHVDLALPTPRPIGQLWVVVTAYDRSGHQVGAVRRAVLIGPAAAG